MKRNLRDYSEEDVRRIVCTSFGWASIEQLDAFPAPDYVENGVRYWTFDTVLLWSLAHAPADDGEEADHG